MATKKPTQSVKETKEQTKKVETIAKKAPLSEGKKRSIPKCEKF